MKNAFIYSCALLLTAALLCPVIAATDSTGDEDIHTNVAYGTPTIDGELDECYLQSQRIEYRLQPWYTGNREPLSEAQAKEKYPWDTGVEAYSYMLWDDSNIYVYVSVKDDTSGCVDFDKADCVPIIPDIYTYQDGVYMSVPLGDHPAQLFAERDGRFFGSIYGNESIDLKDFATNDGNKGKKLIGLNSEHFVTVNSENGYVTEFRIPLTQTASERLSLGAKQEYRMVIRNYIDTLPYSPLTDGLTAAGFEGGVWYLEMKYGTKYDLDTTSGIFRYADLVGTDSGDVNGDGAVDVRDIVRLMKNIASDITPEPVFDVSLDGELDSRDLVSLMKKIAVG